MKDKSLKMTVVVIPSEPKIMCCTRRARYKINIVRSFGPTDIVDGKKHYLCKECLMRRLEAVEVIID